jgi:hypothetical protein
MTWTTNHNPVSPSGLTYRGLARCFHRAASRDVSHHGVVAMRTGERTRLNTNEIEIPCIPHSNPMLVHHRIEQLTGPQIARVPSQNK